MKIIVLRSTIASGKRLQADKKKKYDVSDKDGRLLISMGKAVSAEKVEEEKGENDENSGKGEE